MRPVVPLLTAFLAVATNPAVGQTPLKGVWRMTVVIALSQTPGVGLDSSRLRTMTELRLRTAGLIVVGPAAGLYDVPVLAVEVTAIPATQGEGRTIGFTYATNVKVTRLGRSVTDSSVFGPLEIWSNGGLNITGKDDVSTDVEKTINDWLDQFLNDWLAANPKR